MRHFTEQIQTTQRLQATAKNGDIGAQQTAAFQA